MRASGDVCRPILGHTHTGHDKFRRSFLIGGLNRALVAALIPIGVNGSKPYMPGYFPKKISTKSIES